MSAQSQKSSNLRSSPTWEPIFRSMPAESVKRYRIKEIFLTLQGEGARSGRVAVFCRFSGCNLWSGREEDRDRAACRFCDTDFLGTDGNGGGELTGVEIVARAKELWAGRGGSPYVVCTGGEPLLQLDFELIERFHAEDFEVAVETNGTQLVAPELKIDWVTVSPKCGTRTVQHWGSELKVVFPQEFDWDALEKWDFTRHYVQPMDGPDRERNTRLAVAFCLSHPVWELSQQAHKELGIP